MSSGTMNYYIKVPLRGHQSAFPAYRLSDLYGRPVVHPEAQLRMNPVKETCVYQHPRAGRAFFGRLKHQIDRRKRLSCLLHLRKQQGGSAKGCCMQVMSACMHYSRYR